MLILLSITRPVKNASGTSSARYFRSRPRAKYIHAAHATEASESSRNGSVVFSAKATGK